MAHLLSSFSKIEKALKHLGKTYLNIGEKTEKFTPFLLFPYTRHLHQKAPHHHHRDNGGGWHTERSQRWGEREQGRTEEGGAADNIRHGTHAAAPLPQQQQQQQLYGERDDFDSFCHASPGQKGPPRGRGGSLFSCFALAGLERGEESLFPCRYCTHSRIRHGVAAAAVNWAGLGWAGLGWAERE